MPLGLRILLSTSSKPGSGQRYWPSRIDGWHTSCTQIAPQSRPSTRTRPGRTSGWSVEPRYSPSKTQTRRSGIGRSEMWGCVHESFEIEKERLPSCLQASCEPCTFQSRQSCLTLPEGNGDRAELTPSKTLTMSASGYRNRQPCWSGATTSRASSTARSWNPASTKVFIPRPSSAAGERVRKKAKCLLSVGSFPPWESLLGCSHSPSCRQTLRRSAP